MASEAVEAGAVEDGLDLFGSGEGGEGEVINESEVLGPEGEEAGGGSGEVVSVGNGGLGVVVKADSSAEESAEGTDLFEAALTEGKVSESSEGKDGAGLITPSRGIYGQINNQQYQGRRYFCYVGNMNWWTTDEDLAQLINSTGLPDLLDIKFYENRANGQSKGFALVVFASDNSVRAVMEKLPKLTLHAQQLIVLPYTKQAQAQLEAATRKPGEKAPASAKAADANKGPNFMGTVRLGSAAPPPQPQHIVHNQPQLIMRPAGPQMMGLPPGARPPGQPMQMHGQMQMRPGLPGLPHQPMGLPHQQPRLPPPGHAHPPGLPPPNPGPVPLIPPPATHRPPPGLPPQQPQHLRPPGYPPHQAPPPGAHINPLVYRPPTAGAMGHDAGSLSEAEFEEIMNRNRTVSSSAISRAVSDAAAGDFASAIETLVTAISLIRQSRVAQDDRCKVLITSLQDTLHGIESKSFGAGGGKGRRRERSRSPRDRSSKRHRRSSRSRSRSRERYDDYRTSSGSSSRRY